MVTWGAASSGGDSSAVRDQLRGVQRIQATERAFAAILEDGSVVTWGDAAYGSDSSQKGPLLRFWKMDPLLPALMQPMAVTVGCAADSGHRQGLCCDSGRWIRCYLG